MCGDYFLDDVAKAPVVQWDLQIQNFLFLDLVDLDIVGESYALFF